jgi:hypothetical protein
VGGRYGWRGEGAERAHYGEGGRGEIFWYEGVHGDVEEFGPSRAFGFEPFGFTYYNSGLACALNGTEERENDSKVILLESEEKGGVYLG